MLQSEIDRRLAAMAEKLAIVYGPKADVWFMRRTRPLMPKFGCSIDMWRDGTNVALASGSLDTPIADLLDDADAHVARVLSEAA
jgi:hypothetical protein